MKLFYSTVACSLSPHIVLRELGLPFDLEPVNLKTGRYHGGDYSKVNPKGYVPALRLDDGSVLTEGAVIVQYLADLKPELGLLPPAGSLERVRCQEWLVYIATEIHKGFSPLFSPDTPVEQNEKARKQLATRIAFAAERLAEAPYLMGDRFTVADAYLFTVLNWSGFVQFDLSPWPSLTAYLARMRERPSVRAAFEAEGFKG